MRLNPTFARFLAIALISFSSLPALASPRSQVSHVRHLQRASSVMTPLQLVAALKTKKPPIPVQVGFEFLYKQETDR